MKAKFSKFLSDDAGATAIEYRLIAGLISVVIITALSTLGSNINAKLSSIASSLT